MKDKQVAYQHRDRQWDARFNVQDDNDLKNILVACETFKDKCRYLLVGGVEVGNKPTQSDYNVKHVHVGIYAHNPVSKMNILKNLKIIEGNGYYLYPRNRDYPFKGWRDHHIKEDTKVDKSKTILFEYGTLPDDVRTTARFTKRSEKEKSMTNKDILLEINALIEKGKDNEAFELYPRNYLIYGERIKARQTQKRKFKFIQTDPHLWVYGFPGSGKTTVLAYIYPNHYKKNLDNKYFDLYNPSIHSHVLLEDVDPTAVEGLGSQFMKTLCDSTGFPIDQKYKSCQPARATILISSNYSIADCFGYEEKGKETTIQAMKRRFYEIRIDNLLRFLGLQLISKYDQRSLQSKGNADISKLFIDYDYVSDCPTGYEIHSPEFYRKKIACHYYQQPLPEEPTKKLKKTESEESSDEFKDPELDALIASYKE